jgi:hypothetical protein
VNLDDVVCQHLGLSAQECHKRRITRQTQMVALWMVFGLTLLMLAATT